MMRHIYLALAAMMLLCLAPMPYGYFMLVRFVAMVAFGWFAYRYYMMNKVVATWVFGILALLFQPIYKIALGRTVWNIVDVIVAIFLIALFIMELRSEKKNKNNFTSLPPTDNPKMEDNTFEFQLEGKLASNELVYIASEEDKELNELFETKPEVFEGWGQMIGFHIIYLPALIKQLKKKEVLQYRVPYLNDAELSNINIGNDFLLQYLDNPADKDKIKHGFIRTTNIHQDNDGKAKAINKFYPLSSKNGEPVADQLHRIAKQIVSENSERRLASGRPRPSMYDLTRGSVIIEPQNNKYELPFTPGQYDVIMPSHKHEKADNDDKETEYIEKEGFEESEEELLLEIKEKIEKLRLRGISQQILEQLIHPDDRLSRMVITKEYLIMLPDYNNMEIKMEPLVKAVYLLFLKHPEGIIFKHLPDYRNELAEIYEKLKPYGMNERVLQSIEDVTNPLLNSINEKCARIRGAFVGQFDDRMASHYYINGPRGGAKKIALPRELVQWE